MVEKKLKDINFEKIDVIKYYPHREEIISEVYLNKKYDNIIIVDKNISKVDYAGAFSYREYTNLQNQYMKKYKLVYRFLEKELLENFEKIEDILNEKIEIPFLPIKNINREGLDASYLEHHFEKVFFEMYGDSSFNCLIKEERFLGFNGENIFADYVIEKEKNKIVIEENGESYHHPQKIGEARYLKQIQRQNALVYQGCKVYRFSINEIEFKERMVEEMAVYFGKKEKFIPQNLITSKRKYKLYDHQEITLDGLKNMREIGVKSLVIVQPTGTGKSTVGQEDIKGYLLEPNNKEKKVLILVPTVALKNQWIKNLKEYFINIQVGESKENTIQIKSYNKIVREKNEYLKNEFGYILIDEAHHSTAPGLTKVIKYFNPDFILGMTATHERLDNKKLEDIFSKLEINLTLKEAIEKEICSPIRIFRLESNINLSEVRFKGKDYVVGDLEKKIVVNSRNELIADTINKYFGNNLEKFKEKQGIIFCVNIKHAEIMAKLLNSRGITAKAVSGKDKNSKNNLQDYLDGKIRFLCSCQLISEGWDAPKTSVIVMARPTMSKVLYYQQIGRGTRKTKGKESLYLIDVVDNYGFNSVPWSGNAIFNNVNYLPFSNVVTGIRDVGGEIVFIEHLLEREVQLKELSLDTFENKYGDMINSEELARELFVSTSTVTSWIKKKEINPDFSSEIGNAKYYGFLPERVEEIRIFKKLKKRDNTTIDKDFWEFIMIGDYTFSYKIIFILSLLKHVAKDGESDFEKVKNEYKNYYKKRLKDNLVVDKKKCPYTEEYLEDNKEITKNIIVNPFEKFERKRFMYYGKDIKNIGFNFYLWEKLTSKDLKKLKIKMLEDLKNYYKDLGGEGDISQFI
ncbi:MAG: DEAD/DEAH box helicase [Fusobacteriaceae bacterium]